MQVEGTTETAVSPAPEVLGKTEIREQALPRTGSHGNLRWIGIGSLVMGLGLLGVTRRPVTLHGLPVEGFVGEERGDEPVEGVAVPFR